MPVMTKPRSSKNSSVKRPTTTGKKVPIASTKSKAPVANRRNIAKAKSSKKKSTKRKSKA